MDQARTFTKLLRVLQFRKHVKELTSACKRINKDGCYEFVATKTETLSSTEKKRSKKSRKKSSSPLLTQTQPTAECPSAVDHHNEQPLEHLLRATATSPANLSMIISQSYKPLHAKSSQFNKNTIAVTRDTTVKALYQLSNWVFIEKIETGETGFVPIYCLRFAQSANPTSSAFDSPSQNNISLLNVSIYDKPRYSRLSVLNDRSYNALTPPPGRFISSIGPCHLNNELQISTCPRPKKSATYTRQQFKDQSVLSRQISNISLHAYDTLDMTTCKSSSYSVLDKKPLIFRPNHRLRVTNDYQKQFVGDVSVLESEVVTLVDINESCGDWRLVRRGDGKQGYIPKDLVVEDRTLN